MGEYTKRGRGESARRVADLLSRAYLGRLCRIEKPPIWRRQDLGEGISIKTERLQIDQLVDVAKTLLGSLPLVECGRSGRLDSGAYQTYQKGGRGP